MFLLERIYSLSLELKFLFARSHFSFERKNSEEAENDPVVISGTEDAD